MRSLYELAESIYPFVVGLHVVGIGLYKKGSSPVLAIQRNETERNKGLKHGSELDFKELRAIDFHFGQPNV